LFQLALAGGVTVDMLPYTATMDKTRMAALDLFLLVKRYVKVRGTAITCTDSVCFSLTIHISH